MTKDEVLDRVKKHYCYSQFTVGFKPTRFVQGLYLVHLADILRRSSAGTRLWCMQNGISVEDGRRSDSTFGAMARQSVVIIETLEG